MELQQLQYFQMVAYYEHITRAAEQLNISQPALSSTITRLESELGTQLFDRSGRSVVLNRSGKLFLEHVNMVLRDLDNARGELRAVQDEQDNYLRLAVSTSQFFNDLPSFLRAHPAFRWKQTIADNPEAARMLRFNQVDLAVISPGIYGDEFVTTPLIRERFMLCVNKAHPLAKRESVRLADVLDECFILLPKGWSFREQTDQLFETAGSCPTDVIECDHSLRRDLLEANVGVSIASESSLRRKLYNDDVRLIALEDVRQTREIALVRLKGRHQNTAMRQFTEFMKSSFGAVTL